MRPKTSVSRMKRPPYSSARSVSPAPIALPIMMAVAFAMPKATTVASWRATCATLFAATAALPRWPMTTEFIAEPAPQSSSLIITGTEYVRKSRNKSGSRTKISRARRRTVRLIAFE